MINGPDSKFAVKSKFLIIESTSYEYILKEFEISIEKLVEENILKISLKKGIQNL